MTQEKLMEVIRTGKNLDYELGREAAKQHIAEGNPEIYDNFPALVKVFGADWVNGYLEYRNAWAVLNRA